LEQAVNVSTKAAATTTSSEGQAPLTKPHDNLPPSLSEAELASVLTSLSSQLSSQDDPSSLVSGLVQLATLPVTVPALLATGVGKVVRKLKDREGKVGRLAGKLVTRWKRLVLQYEPSTAACQPKSAVQTTDRDIAACGCEIEQFGTAVREEREHNENDEDCISSPPSKPKSNYTIKKSHSVLEQTGLASQQGPLLEEELVENDPPDRDDVWDGFDEGVVSFGTEYVDNFALAEESEMWTSANDPALEFNTLEQPTHPPAHPTPVMSVSEPLLSSPVHSLQPYPALSSPSPQLRSITLVTPLPDYHTMLTPYLRAELKKFGLKAVPRRKACLLLNHIYAQTHPLVPSTPLSLPNRLLHQPTAMPHSKPDPAPAYQPEDDLAESESEPELSHRLVYYDLETTGLGIHNKHKDIEILEIGAVDGETKDTFRQYILPPGNHIPRDASNVHGIYLKEGALYRDNKNLEAVDLKTGLQNFLRWLKDINRPIALAGCNRPIALAGYNNHNYDDWVICHNLLRVGLSAAEDGRVGKFLDVSKIVRPYLRSKLGERKWSLTFAVKTCLGRGQSDAHSAVSDAVDTLDLMVRLADEEAPEKAYNNAEDVENMCDRLAKGLPLEETKVAKEKAKKSPKPISKRKARVNCESHRVTRSASKRRKVDSISTAEVPGNVKEPQKAPRAPRAARAPRKPRSRSLKLTPAVA